MARTKTVFTPSELPHVWARQTQDEGRTQTGNFYFRGPVIYSYGRHFPIAKILPSGVVLMTWRGYSNSTAKHINAVRRAINHKEVVYCNDPEINVYTNILHEASRIHPLKNDVENTRKRPHTRAAAAQEIDSIIAESRKLCIALGTTLEAVMKQFKKSTSSSDHVNLALLNWALDRDGFDYAGVITKITKTATAAHTKAEKEAKKKAKENLEKWLKGEFSTYNLSARYTPVMLRLKQVGDEVGDTDRIVETTMGARVSYDAAKLLYSMIKAGKDIKGHNIDGYTVISLNGVLKIGCHEIPREEVNRFAALMNW